MSTMQPFNTLMKSLIESLIIGGYAGDDDAPFFKRMFVLKRAKTCRNPQCLLLNFFIYFNTDTIDFLMSTAKNRAMSA